MRCRPTRPDRRRASRSAPTATSSAATACSRMPTRRSSAHPAASHAGTLAEPSSRLHKLDGHARLRATARFADLHAQPQCEAEADRRLSARHARSRPRLGAGGADRRTRPARGQIRGDPRADRGAGRSGAVPDEPRLCRRHRRDRRAAVARTRRCRPIPQPLSITAVVERLASALALGRARRAGGDARPLGRRGTLCAAQDGDRRDADRRVRAARQDRAGAGVRARRRCGRGGLARHRRALCRNLRLGRGDRRAADRRRRARPSARSCSRTRSRICAST